MISRENINYSLRNIRHSKARSFLTVFSILIGIATIFVFISFGLGLYNYINGVFTSTSANKIIVQSKGVGGALAMLNPAFVLNESDVKAIEKTPGVQQVSPMYFKPIQINHDEQIRYSYLISFNPKDMPVLEAFSFKIERGRMLKGVDEGKVVLGYNYMFENKVFSKKFDLNDKIKVNGIDMKVIGFLKEIGNPSDDSQIYITNDYFEKIFPQEKSYSMIIGELDEKNINSTVQLIEKNLRRERNLEKGKEDFYVQTFEDLINSYTSALNIVVGFIILIALISVLVSSINTANTMITSVLERYKEIGVLKAIGAKNSEVFKIFLFESAFLGFVAGSIGVLLGWGLTSIARSALVSLGWSFLSPDNSPMLFIGCILFATITGAIAGVLPALNASKINTVDALRYE